jgi:hypothetical protein
MFPLVCAGALSKRNSTVCMCAKQTRDRRGGRLSRMTRNVDPLVVDESASCCIGSIARPVVLHASLFMTYVLSFS